MKRFAALTVCILCALSLPAAALAAEHGRKLEQAFKQADHDNDGSLDREEAKTLPRVAKNFDRIDADKSGTITLDEIRTSAHTAAQKMRAQHEAKFAAADKDHDGTLDPEEAKALPRVAKSFDAIDADKSGTVSEEEIRDYAKAHRGGRRGAPKN
jgi:Ca2+-binding EF-hand superfamily protein